MLLLVGRFDFMSEHHPTVVGSKLSKDSFRNNKDNSGEDRPGRRERLQTSSRYDLSLKAAQGDQLFIISSGSQDVREDCSMNSS